jgi:FlaA1/EpsC-like NDP-sugar epimerase
VPPDLSLRAAKLVLVEQAENALFQIHRELATLSPRSTLVPCIADICDGPRMRALFAGHAPAWSSTPRRTSTCR